MFALITQVTIWGAMLVWAVAILSGGRWAWSAGLGLYVLHILSAYQSHYQWSHEVAIDETARQTAEVTGWESGAGLWFNYLFVAILAVDLVMQWKGGVRRFPKTIDGLVFLMILNGAIVFGNGPVRYFGALLCTAILVGWILRARGNSSPAPSPPQ